MIPDLTSIDDEELCTMAMAEKWTLTKAHAIDELARRSLEKPELRERANQAIGLERTVQSRLGPPLGWLGAARILTSENDEAIRSLLVSMNEWNGNEQSDLIRLIAGSGKLAEFTPTFSKKFNWHPKYKF